MAGTGIAGIGGIRSVGITSIGATPAHAPARGPAPALPSAPSPNASVATGFDAAPPAPPAFELPRPPLRPAGDAPVLAPEPLPALAQGPSSDMLEQVAAAYAANRMGA